MPEDTAEQQKPKRQLSISKLFLPLLIITTISVDFTAQRAALLGIACAFAVSLARKETRPSLKDILKYIKMFIF